MSLNSPMSAPFGSTSTKGTPGTYDRHETPILSKPRDTGKDAQPEKFFEELQGKRGGTPINSTQPNTMNVKTK
jgi:hypothetical protein